MTTRIGVEAMAAGDYIGGGGGGGAMAVADYKDWGIGGGGGAMAVADYKRRKCILRGSTTRVVTVLKVGQERHYCCLLLFFV